MENSAEETESDGHSESEKTEHRERRHPTEVSMRAYDLSVEVQSETLDVESMADIAEEKMESLMRHSLRGDLVNIEKNEMSSLFFGSDD